MDDELPSLLIGAWHLRRVCCRECNFPCYPACGPSITGGEPGDEGDGDLDSRDAAELLPIDNDLYQQEISAVPTPPQTSLTVLSAKNSFNSFAT